MITHHHQLLVLLPLLLLRLLISFDHHIQFAYSQACTSYAASATSDTVPNAGSVPSAPTSTPIVTETYDLTQHYNFFRMGWSSNIIGGYGPLPANATSGGANSIAFSLGTYNSDNLNGTYVWNGTLMPAASMPPLFKLYNTYDHALMWYNVSFRFRQSADNEVSWAVDPAVDVCRVRLKFAIFDMQLLDEHEYPNTVGGVWQSGPFGDDHCNTTTWDCFREIHELVLPPAAASPENTAAGVQIDEYDSANVWIEFPSQTATTWTDYSAVFRLNSETNSPPCETCYVAIYVENNGYVEWDTAVFWEIADLTLTRLASEVIWEAPITSFESEIVETRRMATLAEVEALGWPRTNCPHTWPNLHDWHDPATWDSGTVPSTDDAVVEIPEGKDVIIRSCSLTNSAVTTPDVANPYQRIHIPANSTLIFDDVAAGIVLHVEEIWNEGALFLGSESCRLFTTATAILFYGSRATSNLVHDDFARGHSKGLITTGTVDVHGKQFHPTWTRLAVSVYSGDDRVVLQESVNWEVGQEVVLLTSVWKDKRQNHQNERFVITAIGDSSFGVTRNVLYLNTRATYTHYAGAEYQAEVLLLSRRIRFEGSASVDNETNATDYFGGHTEVQYTGVGRFSGVEGVNMGQQNVEARYPFHFHLLYVCTECYVQDSAVHDSNFRGYVIHATHEMTLTRNTAYNIFGHCLYIEDGIEENNTISYNAFAHIIPLGRPAGGSSCTGQYVCTNCDESWSARGSNYWTFTDQELLVPVDVAASCFYAPNAHQRFIGNVASGGWSGFAFINMYRPMGKSLGDDYDADAINPYNRPTLVFDGNTAHSSGSYWGDSGCGSCIYAGGLLDYDATQNAYIYTTGRVSHDTEVAYDGDDEWLVLNNTKTYLCQLGINFWGRRMVIEKYESHDNERGVFFIGENVLRHGLINARSNNVYGSATVDDDREGHLFYDTGVKLFLDDVIFRNFIAEERILMFMTHSDRFCPQGIIAVRNIRYQNCADENYFIWYDDCGLFCDLRDDDEEAVTQGARITAMYDYDGSASLTYKPTIVGTGFDWWNINADCLFDSGKNLWYCPWDGRHEIGFIEIDVPGLTDGDRDADNGLDYDEDYYPQSVGYVSQFGKRNHSIALSAYPGVAGYTNTGWYFRPIYGAPAYWIIGNSIQIPRKSFIVVAVRYPKKTTFKVEMSMGWESWVDTIQPAETEEEIFTESAPLYDDVANFNCQPSSGYESCQDTGDSGSKWYFDGKWLYIRVVNMYWYAKSYYDDERWWQNEGMRLWDINSGYYYMITATCDQCDSSYTGYFDVKDEIPDYWPYAEYKKDSEYYSDDVMAKYGAQNLKQYRVKSADVEDLSGGAIAAIVVCVILFVCLMVGGAFFYVLYWKPRRLKKDLAISATTHRTQGNISAATTTTTTR